MLIQQIIAIILILVIFSRIRLRFRRKEISSNEFTVWTVFWFLALMAVLFLRQIDAFVRSIGIVGRGIDIIVYVAVALIFYLIFRVYVRLDKMEREITKVVRKIALDEAERGNRVPLRGISRPPSGDLPSPFGGSPAGRQGDNQVIE